MVAQRQSAELRREGERRALDESYGNEAKQRALAAYRRHVVEPSEGNPIVKPEKKHLKRLRYEQNDLDMRFAGKTCCDISVAAETNAHSAYLGFLKAFNPRLLVGYERPFHQGFQVRVADKLRTASLIGHKGV